MHPCLQTDKCFATLNLWAVTYRERSKDIPLKFLWTVCETVMDENIFQFEEKYFLQIKGTAIGTSLAKEWEIGSYGLHERTTILPNHFNKFLKMYKRFIDDIFRLWLDPNLPPGLSKLQEERYWESNSSRQNFKNDLPALGLTFRTPNPSKAKLFLDVKWTIKKIEIFTRRLTFNRETCTCTFQQHPHTNRIR